MKSDFQKDFEQFNKAQRSIFIFGCGTFAVQVAVLGFVGWVILRLLQHFGVIG